MFVFISDRDFILYKSLKKLSVETGTICTDCTVTPCRASPGPVDLIVDSTGLKVCGQGEWHAKKHGEKERRRWKKLHIGVDNEGWILAQTMTDSHEQDPSQVPALLAQIDRPLARLVGDGIYDQTPVYAAISAHSPGARVIIPPRKDVLTSPTATNRCAGARLTRVSPLRIVRSASSLAWTRVRTQARIHDNRDPIRNALLSRARQCCCQRRDRQATALANRTEHGVHSMILLAMLPESSLASPFRGCDPRTIKSASQSLARFRMVPAAP